jgi:hypothetical protein
MVGFYELQFNRDPIRLLDYEKTCESSEILPIYGKSSLPRYAMYLSQLPLVNRLTEIKQLAYTFVLFPGATHTRYEHSRGVMYRGAKLLENVKLILNKKREIERVAITDDDKIILEVAGLLHDLGHPAWGHALDGITGYVVELLREVSIYLFPPKKLDITITLYLLLMNNQMGKALDICSKEIKDEKSRQLFTKLIAQTIMEEEDPLFEEIANDQKLLLKTHIYTSILGSYHGRKPGINADRLDWLIRDFHHANLVSKLYKKTSDNYYKFVELNRKDNFKIDVDDEGFCFIDDIQFSKLMKSLREKIYSTIYEGIERSFTDSLLIRLAYSTIAVINTIGNDIASAPVTTRAIMGYLLMYDFLMKEYTTRALHLAKEHIKLLGMPDPTTRFIERSDDLQSIADDIKCIMHYLASVTPSKVSSDRLKIEFEYVELTQIDKTLAILTASAFGELVCRAQKTIKAETRDKLGSFFQNIVAASRINAIGALRVPALESNLQADFPEAKPYLLVNYYFFRKLYDLSKDEMITDFEQLKTLLEKNFKSTPLFFAIIEKSDTNTISQILEKLCTDILQRLIEVFHVLK